MSLEKFRASKLSIAEQSVRFYSDQEIWTQNLRSQMYLIYFRNHAPLQNLFAFM
jgi:hypothetical protein